MVKNGRIRYVLGMSQKQSECGTYWSALGLLIIALVKTPEAADHVLPEVLELHQSQVCCHLNLIYP